MDEDGSPQDFVAPEITASDIEEAAAATAAIAVDCGNCHRATGVEPDFVEAGDPAEWADTASHMQRHQWAADRLWEGLIGPSDGSWSRGIRMLAEEPLLGTVTGWDDADSEEGDYLARQVHELGRDAASALTPDARITVYQKMLATCATCHVNTAGGPRPD